MTNNKTHIILSSLALILCFSLLVPSGVKLLHAFEEHKHEVCEFPQENHYHELDLDCEFYKFNQTNQIYFENSYESNHHSLVSNQPLFSLYYHLKSHQHLSFSLRGPPHFIV